MEQILGSLCTGLFIFLGILSIYRSIKYGIISHNFWKGILLLLLFGIIAFGIFFSLCGGSIIVHGFFGGGNISFLPYLNLLIISSFLYWYGILGFHKNLINRILSLGGFIFINIAVLILLSEDIKSISDISNFLSSGADAIMILLIGSIIWGIMIYAIMRIWNFDPKKI